MSDLSKKNCQACQNAQWCKYIHPYVGSYCPGMEIVINNQKPLKEPLASDLIGEGYEGFTNQDYKDVMNEIGKNKKEEHITRHWQIMEMPDSKFIDLRQKCIAALLFFGVTPVKIAQVLKVTVQTIYNCSKSGQEKAPNDGA
jgi:hypothetical protein